MSQAIGHEAAGEEFKIAIEEERGKTINTYGTTFFSSLGCHEYFSLEMWRGAITELVATATIMFTLTSSVISCLDSKVSNPNLIIPFVIFINGFVFLLVTIPLSGGHMNPIFTYIALLKGIITFSRATVYVSAQCIGSIIGFIIVKVVMNVSAVEKYSLGGCVIGSQTRPLSSSGLSPTKALVMEMSCTFVLLYVGVTLGFDKLRSKELGLPMVCAVLAGVWAMVVFVSISVTGKEGYGGVGLNPARCLGAAFVEGGPLWYGLWVFWAGPILACTIYHVFSLSLPREEDSVEKTNISGSKRIHHYDVSYFNPITTAHPATSQQMFFGPSGPPSLE